MFYCGGTNNIRPSAVGLATSTDGKSWTKHGSNPILNLGGAGAFDEVYIHQASVIYDIYESDSNKKWKMWYSGQDSSGAIDIGYATAPAPEGTWTKYASNPIINNIKEGHGVIRLGNFFFLSVPDTSYDLRAYYSGDGISWTLIGTILTRGTAGQWDDLQLRYTTVYWNQGLWYLFFGGYQQATTLYKLGMALSTTGFTWTKWTPNPILGVGATNAWDDKFVYGPSVMQLETTFYLWYSGQGVDSVALPRSIGLATIEVA